MTKKNDMVAKIGSWAFIIGVLIALVVGLMNKLSPMWVAALFVLGIIVGFLNVTGKETSAFLMASVSLVIVTGMGSSFLRLEDLVMVGPALAGMFKGIMFFVIPASIVVCMKAIYVLAADE
jgi:hypothetical protein